MCGHESRIVIRNQLNGLCHELQKSNNEGLIMSLQKLNAMNDNK